MLLRKGSIDEALIKNLSGGRRSGFSIDNQVRIGSQDQPGREKLPRLIQKVYEVDPLLCPRCAGNRFGSVP